MEIRSALLPGTKVEITEFSKYGVRVQFKYGLAKG
jgi:hypothetical protein